MRMDLFIVDREFNHKPDRVLVCYQIKLVIRFIRAIGKTITTMVRVYLITFRKKIGRRMNLLITPI